MNRRTFLKRGLVGGAILLFGGGGLALIPTKELAVPAKTLAILTPRNFQVLVAVSKRVLQGTAADPVRVVDRVDDLLTRMPLEVQSDFNNRRDRERLLNTLNLR